MARMVAQDVDRKLLVSDELDVSYGMLLDVRHGLSGPMVDPVPEVDLVGVEGGRLLLKATGRMVWQIFGTYVDGDEDKETFDRRRMDFWSHVNSFTLDVMVKNSALKGFERARTWMQRIFVDFDYEDIVMLLAVILFVVGLVYRVGVLLLGGGE